MAKASSDQAKWRHFHPQATVWVRNPFNEDVEFKAADENDMQFSYVMPAGKISELPGGLVATLGVRKLVNRKIQSSPDVHNQWDPAVRAKYEDGNEKEGIEPIIVRIKEAPTITANQAHRDEINLGVDGSESTQETKKDEVEEKPVFPEPKKRKVPSKQVNDAAIANIAAASLPAKDVEIKE